MRLVFGDCVIDPDCFELRRRGKLVKLEPKVFDVLMFLVERRDRVVTKEELLDALWPGEAVSDSVLPRCIAAMRRALGDTRTRQRAIATAHGRGYRFVGEVTSDAEAASGEPSASTNEVASARAGAPSHGGGAPRARSDFVGRADRLERLGAALERTASGSGGVTFIVGEPGIGKTRLAEEFAERAERAGFSRFMARCHEGEGAPVYWPWVQILRDALAGLDDPDTLRDVVGAAGPDLAELVPELETRLGALPRAGGPEGEQARFRLYDSVTRFLVRLAERRPILLVIDDLHWADASSLGLLRFLAGQIARSRLLVVGTYRDVDVRRGHPLSDVLGALARDETCERLALDGFDEDEIGAFISGLTEVEPSRSLVTTMRDRTEGNPFFLREIVRLLADEEDLDGVDASRLDSLRLPQGVRDAIGRRLDGLSPECNEVLRAASVIGRSFRLGPLSAMLEDALAGGMDELLELLAEALDAGIVQEGARGRYAFAHALTRQTLYEELRAPQRTQLHRRAGEALERHLEPTRSGEENLPELAHHFYEAAAGGDVAKSIAYSVSAAEAAHRRTAYDEAVAFYERATEVSTLETPLDEQRHAELLLALGEAMHVAGRRGEALATLDRAATLARRLEDWRLLARVAIAIRNFGELGSRPAAGVMDLLYEAFDRLPEEETSLRSQLSSRLAHANATTMDDRMALSTRALDLAERSGDPIALRDAWFSRWWATLGPDRIRERFEVVQALSSLADRTGDVRTRLLSLEAAFGAHLICGDRAAIESSLDELERVAGELRQPAFVFMAMNYRTSWLIDQGRFSEAEALVARAFDYGDGVVPFAAMACAGQTYWSRNLRGDRIDHGRSTEELVRLLETTLMPEPMRELFVTIMRYSADGDSRSAHDRLSKVDVRALDRDENWLIVVTTIAEIALDVGDRPLVEWLYEALKPYERLVALHDLMRVGRGAVGYSVGLLAVGLGKLDQAIGHFEVALEVEERVGMAFSCVPSRVGLAGALARRGAPGDDARVEALLDQARAEAGRLGLGEESAVRRYLEAKNRKNPFDSDIWRRIEAS